MYFDCKVEDYHEGYGITQADCNQFARLLIQAINTVCPGPLSTMSYFQSLAAYEIGKFGVDPKLVARRRELNRISDPTSEELHELNDICIELEEQSEELVYGNGEKEISWKTPSGFNVVYTSLLHDLLVVYNLRSYHVLLSYSYAKMYILCLLYTSPSPRDRQKSRMPSSA